MLYAIVTEDKPDSLAIRMAARADHLVELQKMRDAGRLFTAGPLPAIDSEDPGEAGFTGSLIVAEFDSLEEATQWAENDPYNKAGLFARITVKPFKKVF